MTQAPSRRLIANLTLLFTEVPLIERIAAARRAGFDAVEILWPYQDLPDPAVLARALEAAEISLELINSPRGNSPETHWGLAALPGQETAFRTGIEPVLHYAAAVKVPQIHVLSGQSRGAAAEKTLITNLRWLCDQAPLQGFTLEPLCAAAVEGYFLNDYDLAQRIIAAVGRPNLGLQFDLYHASQIGNWHDIWNEVAPITRHVQIAEPPNRHEPGPTANAFLSGLPQHFHGAVAAEYFPKHGTSDGLGWVSAAQEILYP